jgi:hypothetical protein
MLLRDFAKEKGKIDRQKLWILTVPAVEEALKRRNDAFTCREGRRRGTMC